MLRTSDRLSFFGKLLLCVALLGWPLHLPPTPPIRPRWPRPDPPASVSPPPPVGTLTETILLTGTLVARDEVMVGAEIDGLAITELLAEEGDKVTRGQVLARLSRDMLDAQFAQNAASLSRALAAIAQAQNQIAEAEATARQADAAFARARSLEERGNTTAETLEQREAASLVARARVSVAEDALRLAQADKELAEAQRQEIQVRLARTEIKAPAAGTISRRDARLGALVSSAAEPLFRIIGAGTIEVEADVPEISLARLRVGQKAAGPPGRHGGAGIRPRPAGLAGSEPHLPAWPRPPVGQSRPRPRRRRLRARHRRSRSPRRHPGAALRRALSPGRRHRPGRARRRRRNPVRHRRAEG